MIEKMKLHYAFTNPASIHDEEALTALELAGRQGAKINEIVEAQNDLKTETEKHLKNQDAAIVKKVDEAIQENVNGGAFDQHLNQYTGNMNEKLAQKVGKNEPGVIGMVHLTQEVKNALTGGSVANVGAHSIDSVNIIPKSVTPDKLSCVVTNVQHVYPGNYSANTCWATRWSDAQSRAYVEAAAGDGTYTVKPFVIAPGETYYMFNIRGNFSFIQWEGITEIEQISGTDGETNYVKTADRYGVVYITINRPHAALIQNYPLHIPGVAGYTGIQVVNHVPELGLIKKLGLSEFEGDKSEFFNGANGENNFINIPVGATGYNSYVSRVFKTPFNRALFAVNYTITGELKNVTPNLLPEAGGNKLQTLPQMFVENEDGSTTWFAEADTTGHELVQLAIQCFDNTLSDNVRTLRVNGVWYLPENGIQSLLDNLNATIEAINTPTVKTVRVRKDGYGDYTSLRECFADIKPTPQQWVRVMVYSGVYELADEYTTAELNAEDFKGLFIPDYVILEGAADRKDVIIQLTLDNKRELISTLNLSNTAQMKNLTVKGTKTRYVIHDDFASPDESNYERIVENCEFIGHDTFFDNAYGTGCQQGAKITYKNCVFRNMTGGVAFSNHNNVGFTLPCSIEFENCRFYTSDNSACVRLGSLNNGAYGVINYVTFNGCKFENASGKTVKLIEENATQYGAGILFKVSGYGNHNLTPEIINTDGKNYSGYVDVV